MNSTRNQHYISQIEQRLNSINPNAKTENQKIFQFDVIDREKHSARKAKVVKIENTLSLQDLFSFDVINNNERYNFEHLFNRYEAQVAKHTNALLAKVLIPNSDLKEEIYHIFLYKFLNFVRNPFSIKKMLNTFPGLHTYSPVSVPQQQDFERILNGKKPHQKYRCRELEITDDDYIRWLKTIFLLINCYEGDSNFIEQVVAEIFNSKETEVYICVYRYSNQNCLLSDTEFTVQSYSNGDISFDFNLNKNAFIRYVFLDIHSHIPSGVNEDTVHRYLGREKDIRVQVVQDDMSILDSYNKLTLYQSTHNVFCASNQPMGILIS